MEVVHPAWIDEPKEHDHQRESQARVKRGGEGHCVLAPPGTGATADKVVEEEANYCPYGEVETGLFKNIVLLANWVWLENKIREWRIPRVVSSLGCQKALAG